MEGLTIFSAIGVIVLAALAHATLQMNLGSLLLLYHESIGKYIKKRVKFLFSNYIFGVFFLITTSLAATAYFIFLFFGASLSTICLVILASTLVALTLCIWLFYYRTGRSTELWLPKPIARYIMKRAKQTDSNIEAFALGLLASFAEAPFFIVLMLIAADSLLKLPMFLQIGMFLAYVLIALSPLITLRLAVRHGKTVVEIQKWRLKNKNFLKILSGTFFITLAIFLLAFRIIQK